MKELRENEELDNWVGWLQQRISELKSGANESWIRMALDGYAESKLKESEQRVVELEDKQKLHNFDFQKLEFIMRRYNAIPNDWKHFFEDLQINHLENQPDPKTWSAQNNVLNSKSLPTLTGEDAERFEENARENEVKKEMKLRGTVHPKDSGLNWKPEDK